MKNRVVITGMGIVSPIGIGVDQFWKACMNSDTSIASIPDRWRHFHQFRSTIWSPLPELDPCDYGIKRTSISHLDRGQQMSLIAAEQALNSARLSCRLVNKKKEHHVVDGVDADRCGVFIGNGFGGATALLESHANQCLTPLKGSLAQLPSLATGADDRRSLETTVASINDRMDVPFRFHPFTVAMSMPNACAAAVGIRYGIKGPNRTYCNACASGTLAIGEAFRAISSGMIDMAVAGGAEYFNDTYGTLFRTFDMVKALVSGGHDMARANRPFDKERSGFLFSEGAAALLTLESLEHARRRGAPIIAEISAFCETFDAYSLLAIDPCASQIKKLIGDVLKQADLSAGDIDYINAHGTGTEANDRIEAEVIDAIFGKNVRINTTKSLTGHTIGACGAIETIVTALSIYHQCTHACKNLEDPIADLNFITQAGPYPIKRAINQSFAFGGHNAALILEGFEA